MARTLITQEVEVLRFFETGSLEKVEAVFNIVSEKLRERRDEHAGGQDIRGRKSRVSSRKRAAALAEDEAAGTRLDEPALTTRS